MANSISFDTTYAGGQVSTGLYAAVLGGSTFTGTSLLASGTSYSINGTVSAVGSTVSVSQVTAGIVTTASTATYEGYVALDGATYYIFSDPTLLGVGGGFAVSSTGATVNLTALEPITAAVPTTVCFLAGTGILTADGEVAIETLRPGDEIAVLRNGRLHHEPVRWLGRGTARPSSGPSARDDAPIRIKAGALGDALPTHDLLVTPEHCLLLDGVLIPARMLVNHGSITSDVAHGAYDFFHVELDRHGILIANGVEAESYLDTGNRANFHNNDVSTLQAAFALPAMHAWPVDAAAPLAVDRAIVEPIWNRLADRARALGFTTVAATTAAVVDADLELRIVTEAGHEILPTLADGQVHAFVVPAGSGTLRLRSRSARPSDAIGPFLDDRRTLGVQIGRIGVGDTRQRGSLDTHLTADRLPGWHATEAEGTRRWTDGNAVLPIDTAASADTTLFVDIEVVGVGPYRAIAKAA